MWVRCKDKLPEDGQEVLFYCPREQTVLAGDYNEETKRFGLGYEGAIGYPFWDVSHWMPFPDPPKAVFVPRGRQG